MKSLSLSLSRRPGIRFCIFLGNSVCATKWTDLLAGICLFWNIPSGECCSHSHLRPFGRCGSLGPTGIRRATNFQPFLWTRGKMVLKLSWNMQNNAVPAFTHSHLFLMVAKLTHFSGIVLMYIVLNANLFNNSVVLTVFAFISHKTGAKLISFARNPQMLFIKHMRIVFVIRLSLGCVRYISIFNANFAWHCR